MKISRSIAVLLFLSVVFFSCKQDQKANNPENTTKSGSTDITDSKEFESYFLKVFSLSNENTKTDLPYVNKFMTDNKLFPFKDVCALLDNELVKSDKRVFDFWKTRCEFNKAKEKLMRKYGIDADSIKILMEKTLENGKYNDKLK